MQSILPRKIERVPIDSVKPFPGNARRGDIAGIRESLRENSQFRVLFVQKSTRYVVYGNQTWQAAKEEGWTEIDAVIVDVDDDQAERINLADNRYGDLATDDPLALLPRLEAFGDRLDGTGFTKLDVDAMKAAMRPPEPLKERAGPSTEVQCKLGTLSWSMSAVAFEDLLVSLTRDGGPTPNDQIREARKRLQG